MIFRDKPTLPAGVRRALPCLLLLLLPVVGTEATLPSRAAPASAGWSDPPRPYLPASGPPPLRFTTPPPPPKRPAPPPPLPAPAAAEPPPEKTAPASSLSAPAATPAPSPDAAPGPANSAGPASPAVKTAPAPILPDDLQPLVRPEDFLPFFQPPRPPAPGTLPPSSAHYIQQ